MFILYNEQKNERNKRNEHKNEQMTFVQFVHFHETSDQTKILRDHQNAQIEQK